MGSIFVHFLDVGQGNMNVIVFPDNFVMVYDCNISDDNEKNILKYMKKILPKNEIDIFVNSHRDSDHMRGIKKLHATFPIKRLWDTDVSSNTDAPEYKEYMDFRRNMGDEVWIAKPNHILKAKPNVKILNGVRDGLDDPNSQSIVLHISNNNSSVLLSGDTDAIVWKDYIMKEASDKIKSDILLASHHGSLTFFDDTRDEKYHYVSHIQAISPSMTIISVGTNPHGHPDKKALEYYDKYSKGSNLGNKVYRTDEKGNIKLELKDDDGWNLTGEQN